VSELTSEFRSFRAQSRNAHPSASRLLFDFARSERFWGALACGVLALSTPAHAAEPAPYQRALAAGYKAAFLCSGIFNAGRTQAQVEALELTGIYPEYQPLIAGMPAKIIHTTEAVQVQVSWSDKMPPRKAVWHDGIGCQLQPIGDPIEPSNLPNLPVPAARPVTLKWPAGDLVGRVDPPKNLREIGERAFAGSYGAGSRSVGLLIVKDGQVVLERYADGFGPLVSNRTWSVAKSLAGTLIGIAVRRRLLDPAKSAAIPEWQGDEYHNDPRKNITLDNLLRMSSGLHSDTAGNRTDALYMGATTVGQETVHWPLEALPGTRFRYANNDILLAIRALRESTVDEYQYVNFPRAELLEKIGMYHTILETDWAGNFILSSQVWSTARDLARLGLLWLNDGVWNGERILPEGWVKYMTTPSGPQPAEGPGYGATMWLFGPDQGVPEGSYAAQGNRGQYIMVIPSQRLVVVRRGEDPVGARFDIAKFSADVAAALK
jgi:CubicO group peptidase (beta-lactamase class C family)